MYSPTTNKTAIFHKYIVCYYVFVHLLPCLFCHITGILECIPFEKPSSSKSVKQELYCRTKFTAQKNKQLEKNS